jgi:autotransporter translocation and assembly factor TamB
VRSKKLIVVAVVFGVATAAVLLVLIRGAEVLRRQAESRASEALGVEVTIGAVRLGGGPSVEVSNIRSELFTASRVRIELELVPLLRKRLMIHKLEVDSLRVEALPVSRTEEPSQRGGAWTVELRRFALRDAAVQLGVGGIDRVESLYASGRYSLGKAGHRLELAGLHCSLLGPDVHLQGVAGEFLHLDAGLTSVQLALQTGGNRLGLDASIQRDTGVLRVSAAAMEVDLAELAAWFGALPPIQGRLLLEAQGALPDVRFTASASVGDTAELLVAGQARVDRMHPRVLCAGKGRFVGRLGGSALSDLSVLFCGASDGSVVQAGLHTVPGSRWGEFSASRATLLATIKDSTVVAAGRATTGSRGDVTLVGRGQLGARRRVDSRVAFRNVDPTGYGGPPGCLTGEASLGYAIPGPGTALVRLGPSSVGETDVERVHAAAVLAPGTVEVGGIVAQGPWGSAAATGRWRQGDIRVCAVARVESLQHLSPGAPARGALSGVVSGGGRWPRMAGEVALGCTGAGWGDVGFESLAAVASVSGVARELTGRVAVVGRNGRAGWLQMDSVVVFGQGGAAASEYVLKLDGDQAALHLSGASRHRTLLLNGAQLRLGDVRFQTIRPWKVSVQPGGVAADTLFLAALGCSLRVEGAYLAGRGQGSVDLVGLDLSQLAPFAPVALGTASGEVALQGVFEGPPWNGSGALTLTNGEYRGAGLSLLAAEVTAAEGRATVQAKVEQRGVERVRLTGGLVGEDWTARVVVEEPDLSAAPVFIPGLSKLSGRLRGDVLLKGSGSALRSFDGEVSLSDGLVRVEPLNQDFRVVGLTVKSQGGAWEVSDLSVLTDGGRAAGRLTYDGGRVAGQLELRRLPLRATVGGSGVLDGNVLLSSPDGSPQISGGITVQEAQVLIDELAKRKAPGEGSGALVLPPWAEPVHGELTVAIPRNCWMRSVELEVEITGELRVTKQADALQLWGEVETVRGSYRFQGKLFTVEKGRVSFTGSEVPDPELEVEARHRLRDRLTGEDIVVIVDLTGTVARPLVSLRSEPPMEDVDILSYLLMGRPSSELVAAEQSALMRSVSGLLAGQATQRLARSVGQALGFDTFEVETAGAPALRMGSYLGGRVYLEYTQELKRDGARGIRLDYHLGKGFSLEATSTTLGETGLDLVWSEEF